jgi:hypothetical protein
LGLVTLWFTKHYDQSALFHWAMIIGWALFAWIHVRDVRSLESLRGPSITAIPFALLLVTALLRFRKS